MEGQNVRRYRQDKTYRKYRTKANRRHGKLTAALFRVAVVLCLLLFACGGIDYYQNRNLNRTFGLLRQVGETAETLPAKLRDLVWRAEEAIHGLGGRQTPSSP